jgi:mevalonate kinase
MAGITATAPGKIILFGEHAVVYGRPAIAVPIHQVHARAVVMPDITAPRGRIRIHAPDINLDSSLEDLPDTHFLRKCITSVISELAVVQIPAFMLQVSSTIPIAAGMGSGAAISVSVMRAVSSFLGHPLPNERVSSLTFEVEKLLHGTPSGIDNTVISYGLPVFFIKDPQENLIQTFTPAAPFNLVIGDTGVRSPTSITVGDVRREWQADTDKYEQLFDQIGEIALNAHQKMQEGEIKSLGYLMNDNHALLKQIGVSSPELDRLVEAANRVGAFGAKLSGGGRGGNMIALTSKENSSMVAHALVEAGAINTIETEIRGKNGDD